MHMIHFVEVCVCVSMFARKLLHISAFYFVITLRRLEKNLGRVRISRSRVKVKVGEFKVTV